MSSSALSSAISITSTQSKSKRTRFSEDSGNVGSQALLLPHDDPLFLLFHPEPSVTVTIATDEDFGKGPAEASVSVLEDARVTRGGMRVEQNEPPPHCLKYLDCENFAEKFIENLLDEAINRSIGLSKISSMKIIEGVVYEDDDDTSHYSIDSAGTYVCVLEWPSIQEFTVDLGLQKIQEFVSYWVMKESWMYCVNYLKGQSDEIADFHQYEVLYSIPCCEYPIAQATASVFFTIEVSRIRPKTCLVEVFYCFEGSRLRHTPGKYLFQEVWLFDIVDAKINLFKTLNF